MKSYLVTHASYITDKDNYTDLQVLRSGGGYYVGTLYRTDEGWDEPGSRDSDYFATKDDATTELERLLAGGTPHTKMTHSKHNETTRWLDTLKPGDEVCIAGGWNPFIARVGRRTPTQILVEGERYRASNEDGRG